MGAKLLAAKSYCGNAVVMRRSSVAEFTCVGCGQKIVSICHVGDAPLCAFCVQLGPEKSRQVQAMVKPASGAT
jgi:hypothetical protein